MLGARFCKIKDISAKQAQLQQGLGLSLAIFIFLGKLQPENALKIINRGIWANNLIYFGVVCIEGVKYFGLKTVTLGWGEPVPFPEYLPLPAKLETLLNVAMLTTPCIAFRVYILLRHCKKYFCTSKIYFPDKILLWLIS